MNAIEIKNLTKSYKGFLLDNITLTLPSGCIMGLVGENGAGKSTLMRMLATVDFPTKGRICYDKRDIFAMDETYRSLIGYMPQDYSVYPGFTATDFLEYMGVLKGIPQKKLKDRISEVLEFVNLSDAADKKVRTFSGGMKRRIGIAQAIMNEPQILILDEPTAGLDVEGQISLHEQIRQLKAIGKTIILASHDMAEVENLCDRIAILSGGKIAFIGTVGQLGDTIGKHYNITIQTENGMEKYESENIGNSLLSLLMQYKEKGETITDIKIDRGSLEQHFIKIAKGE